MDRVDAIDHAALEGLVDLDRLNEWMTGQDLPGDGPVTGALRLQGGSQNNIFLLQRGDAQMVLRRPPLHLRKNSNDTMLREARVLGAIAGSGVPHPELFGSCDDLDVIGVCFYLMAPIDGFTPPGDAGLRGRPRLAAAPRGGDGRRARRSSARSTTRRSGSATSASRRTGSNARSAAGAASSRGTPSSRATPGRSCRTSTSSASGSRITGPRRPRSASSTATSSSPT